MPGATWIELMLLRLRNAVYYKEAMREIEVFICLLLNHNRIGLRPRLVELQRLVIVPFIRNNIDGPVYTASSARVVVCEYIVLIHKDRRQLFTYELEYYRGGFHSDGLCCQSNV